MQDFTIPGSFLNTMPMMKGEGGIAYGVVLDSTIRVFASLRFPATSFRFFSSSSFPPVIFVLTIPPLYYFLPSLTGASPTLLIHTHVAISVIFLVFIVFSAINSLHSTRKKAHNLQRMSSKRC